MIELTTVEEKVDFSLPVYGNCGIKNELNVAKQQIHTILLKMGLSLVFCHITKI